MAGARHDHRHRRRRGPGALPRLGVRGQATEHERRCGVHASVAASGHACGKRGGRHPRRYPGRLAGHAGAAVPPPGALHAEHAGPGGRGHDRPGRPGWRRSGRPRTRGQPVGQRWRRRLGGRRRGAGWRDRAVGQRPGLCVPVPGSADRRRPEGRPDGRAGAPACLGHAGRSHQARGRVVRAAVRPARACHVKGGTTAAALASFGAAGFAGIVEDALAAAARRSRELAEEFGK